MLFDATIESVTAARRLGVFGVSWKSGPDQPIGRLPVALSTAEIEARSGIASRHFADAGVSYAELGATVLRRW